MTNSEFIAKTEFFYQLFLISETKRVVEAFQLHKKLYIESQNVETIKYFSPDEYKKLSLINYPIFSTLLNDKIIANYGNDLIIQANNSVIIKPINKKTKPTKEIALGIELFFYYKKKRCTILFSNYIDAIVFIHLNFRFNRGIFKYKSLTYYDVFPYIYRNRKFKGYELECKKIEFDGSDNHNRRIQKAINYSERFFIE